MTTAEKIIAFIDAKHKWFAEHGPVKKVFYPDKKPAEQVRQEHDEERAGEWRQHAASLKALRVAVEWLAYEGNARELEILARELGIE